MVTPAMDAPQFQAHSISLPSSLSASTECHRIVSSPLPIELVSRGAVAFVVVVVVIVFCNGGAMKPQGEEETAPLRPRVEVLLQFRNKRKGKGSPCNGITNRPKSSQVVQLQESPYKFILDTCGVRSRESAIELTS